MFFYPLEAPFSTVSDKHMPLCRAKRRLSGTCDGSNDSIHENPFVLCVELGICLRLLGVIKRHETAIHSLVKMGMMLAAR